MRAIVRGVICLSIFERITTRMAAVCDRCRQRLDCRVPLSRSSRAFYYTRAIELDGSFAQFVDNRGFEAGTLRGSQWSPSVFLGNEESGLFGGSSFFFDFQKRPGRGDNSLISSTVTLGYSWDCCAVTGQFSTFNVGLRKENRVVFSFRLNGIGSFGTEQIGQRSR